MREDSISTEHEGVLIVAQYGDGGYGILVLVFTTQRRFGRGRDGLLRVMQGG